MLPISFYAPLKAPDHPVPSGDRRMAQQLMAALRLAGFDPVLASRFRSLDLDGDPNRQKRLRDLGRRLADRALRRILAAPQARRPRLWFTYHLFHKAPDWVGPHIAEALGIPYVVAEASYAPKRAGGPWDLGHRAVSDAVRRASVVLFMNRIDPHCLSPLLSDPARLQHIDPFIEAAPFTAAGPNRPRWAAELGLDPARPWLIATAMMRPGDKLHSYRLLGAVLQQLAEPAWQCVLVGDGEARASVEAALRDRLGDLYAERIAFAGLRDRSDIASLLSSADLYLWPAVREAYGLAFLEAQAAGLPVVAGAGIGVADVVRHGETGVIVGEAERIPDEADFVPALAAAARDLLADPERRRAMAAAARRFAAEERGLEAAARRLRDLLDPLIGRARTTGASSEVA